MLYIAFIKSRPGLTSETDIVAKSRKWWNEGGKPVGLKTIGFYGALGSDTPDVVVFEASNHDDIRSSTGVRSSSRYIPPSTWPRSFVRRA